MKILVLYTRLTGYFFSCMQHDVAKNGNSYFVIRKRPSPDAPFQLNSEEGIELVDGDDLSIKEILKLTKDFAPDLLYVTGWTDKRYLKVARHYKKSGLPVITGLDNQWQATLRQKIASKLNHLLVRKYFTHIWIPGMLQYEFARKLGFPSDKILTNLYSCDLEKFSNPKPVPKKRFIFMGRLVHHKGVDLLLEAFCKLRKNNGPEWELHLIGNGEYAKDLKGKEGIVHIPFLQPDDLPTELHKGGVFVLPSRYEAWGVVVHEAAAAGLPIITTTACGAARHLVFNSYNGFTVAPGNAEALYKAMESVIKLNTEALEQMGQNSYQQSLSINKDIWAGQLNSVR